MNVNAKCVKQNGVLLSAAKNMIKLDKLFNKQQHARFGTLNDIPILGKSAEDAKTFYSSQLLLTVA